MENGTGVDVEGGKCGDGNGELEVGFSQEREKHEDSGLIAFASAVEGNKDFGDGAAKVASDVVLEEEATEMKKKIGSPGKNRTEEEKIEIKEEKPLKKKRGRPPLSRKEVVSIEAIMEQKPQKKRGRPPLRRKEEVSIEVIMEEKPQKKRGRPRKNRTEGDNIEIKEEKPLKIGRPLLKRKEEVSIEVIMEEKPQKKRGRPRKNREEGVSIEKLGNIGVEHVNNESMGNGALAGEEAAKGLNLEHNNAQETVRENVVAEKEGKEVEEENDRRSDEWEKRKSDSGKRNLGQRKSRIEAEAKMVKLRVEDEELEEAMRIPKRMSIPKRRRYGKRHEKGVGFEENGGESEVNNGAGDGGNKKKPGRKPSKGLEKQEENSGRTGEFVDEKEKDEEGVDKKMVGRRQSKGEGEQEEVEEGQSLSNSLRVKKADTEEVSREDENGNSLSNMCHQCQRNDKGRVVRCTNCRTKRYCVCCLNRWYAIHVNER